MEEKAWQSYAMLLYIHSNILVLIYFGKEI